MIRSLLHGFATFLDITALASVIGSAWSTLLIARFSNGATSNLKGQYRRAGKVLGLCLSALVFSSLYVLVSRGIEISGLGLAALFPSLSLIIFKTHFGHMWLMRAGALLAAWICWLIGSRRPGTSCAYGMVLVFAALIAFSRSASGHPADFGDFSSQQIVDWLHLMAVSFLAGTVITAAYILKIDNPDEEGIMEKAATHVAHWYYMFVGPLFSIVVFTGIYSSWFEVGSFSALFSATYGRLLLTKLVLLVYLAVRLIVLPRHRQGDSVFVSAFIRRTKSDALAVLGILLIVSVLVHQVPAKHQAHLAQLAEASQYAAAQNEEVKESGPVVHLETKPEKIAAGSPVSMTVRITNQDGSPFGGLELVHERILHAVIVGKDLDFFAHIHPEDLGPITLEMKENGAFPLSFTFPKVGQYLVGIDFATEKDSYNRMFTLNVGEALKLGEPEKDLSRSKYFGQYKVTLRMTPEIPVAGGDTDIEYVIEKDGKPVKDLQPYLGAAMHMAVVSEDMKQFIHEHGSVPGESHHNHHDHLHAAPPPDRFGPEIISDVVFPDKGIYTIFSQIRHHDKVLLLKFTVEVR